MRQLLHDLEHLADHLRVERARRLVKEHDLRLHHERADDGHALLLAAGELDGVGLRAVAEPDALEKRMCLLLGLGLRHVLDMDGREGHVVEDGHVREEVEMLEDHAHLLPVLVKIELDPLAGLVFDLFLRDVHAVKVDLARRRHLQQVQRPQQRRLAGAGRADDDHHVAALDVDAHIVERLDLALVIVFFQVLDLDQTAHFVPSCAWTLRLCATFAALRLEPALIFFSKCAMTLLVGYVRQKYRAVAMTSASVMR